MSREYPCVYHKNGLCEKDPEPGYINHCVFGPCKDETPSTADRIRAENDDGLKETIHAFSLGFKPWCDFHCENEGDDGCDKCIEKWLRQPAEA